MKEDVVDPEYGKVTVVYLVLAEQFAPGVSTITMTSVAPDVNGSV